MRSTRARSRHTRNLRRRAKLLGALLSAAVTVMALIPAVVWAQTPNAPGAPVGKASKPTPGSFAHASATAIARTTDPIQPTTAPAAASYTVDLPASGAWVDLGSTGLAVANAAPTASARLSRVTVEILSAAQAHTLGASGITLRLSRADSGTSPAAVAVSASTALLNGLSGADYAGHVQWQTVGAGTTHALTTRRVASSSNGAPDAAAPSALSARTPQAMTTASSALITTTQLGSKAVVMNTATTANASDGSGNFGATSLRASSQWGVSNQTGAFTWTYPLRTPPPAAGPGPDMSLSYDSGAIDGQTGSSNNQPSGVGEGFQLTGGGYIERSYVPCFDAGVSTSDDDCWKTDNATLSLNGQSQPLVLGTDGTWRLGNDDNTKVEHLTSNTTYCNNGTYDNDCWRVTTPNGAQYYFGRNHLPGWTSATQNTNSTWLVPVCGTAATACSGGAGAAGPFNTQAWRWNLDYVVDLHGNSEAFYYTKDQNKYAQDRSTTTATTYDMGGELSRIDYGMRAGYELTQTAPEQVFFTYATRCETGLQGEPSGACNAPAPGTAEPSADQTYWHDVPWYQQCVANTCTTSQTEPSFWTIWMLSGIQTSYTTASSTLVNVDQWNLVHEWSKPTDGENGSLELYQVVHNGESGQGSIPPVTFGYTQLSNRVAPPNGIVPLMRPRINLVTLDSGGQINVGYQTTPTCSSSSYPSPQTNTTSCFPQYWAPPGGTLGLDWFVTYPVLSLDANPVVGTSGEDDRTTYIYYPPAGTGAAMWRYDTSPLTPDGQRTWSVFAGYSKVRTEHGDPSFPTTLHVNDITYFQGLDGDLADTSGSKRAVTLTASDNETAHDSLWFAGRAFETITYNGLNSGGTAPGPQVSDVVTEPWTAANPTGTGATVQEKIGTGSTTFAYTPTSRYTGDLTVTTHTPLSAGGQLTGTATNIYDTLGRNTKAEDIPDTSNPTSQATCTTTSYADNPSENLLDLTNEIQVVGVNCSTTPTFPANAVKDTRIAYDGATPGTTPTPAPTVGDATANQVVQSYTSGTPNWLTTATNAYDALGRLTSTTDALGYQNQTAYTPTAPAAGQAVTSDIGPVTQVVDTNPAPFNWQTTRAFDPAWGVLTSETDPNGHTTSAQLDSFGRVAKVWLPDRQPAANFPTPSMSYTYTMITGQPVSIATTTLNNTGATMTSYQMYDGLMRARQTQTPAEGHDATTEMAAPGSNGSNVVDTSYDAAGQVTETTTPYLISNAPSGSIFYPQSGVNPPGDTRTTFDGAGRPTAVITDSDGTEQWRTSTTYNGADRVDTVPPSPAPATTKYTDPRGNLASLLQYHGNAVGDPNNASTYDKTSYVYDSANRMLKVTNQALQQWTWTYDVLGQTIGTTSPDKGSAAFWFNNDGMMTQSEDNRGQYLLYSYDHLGRRTAVSEYQGTGWATDVAYAYDTLSKGQLTSSIRYVGSTPTTLGTAYTTAVTGYTVNDQPQGTSITLPAGALGAANTSPLTYSMSLTYNPDESPATQTDTAVGGLPNETLTTGYTSIGNLYSYKGNSTYLETTGYDGIGRVMTTYRHYLSASMTDTYGYMDGTNRLTSVESVATTTIANRTAYTYDNAGDVTSASNTPTAGTDNQCFSYDYLQRLTQAWTPATGTCATSPSSSNIGGLAPYWQSYNYDTSGDRTSITYHATSSSGTDQQDAYGYPTGTNPARGNAVQTVQHASGPVGGPYTITGTDNYGYNAVGDTTSAPGQTYTWSPQDQLAAIKQTSSGNTQTRIYDADGNLLLQTDPVNGETAFLGDVELHVPAGSSVISGVRTYTAGGHVVAVRTATAGSSSIWSWQDTDPHNTASINENPVSGAFTVRYFDPFGNQRGTAASWPDDRGFLNDPVDPFSALTDIGARDYNSVLGKFVSVDPVLSKTDPQQDNGYSYAENNPCTLSDPSGMRPLDAGGTGEEDPYWDAAQRHVAMPDSGGIGTDDTSNSNGVDYPSYVTLALQKNAAAPHFDAKSFLLNNTAFYSDPPSFVMYSMLHQLHENPHFNVGDYLYDHTTATVPPDPNANPSPPQPKPQHSGCHGFFGCLGHAISSVTHSKVFQVAVVGLAIVGSIACTACTVAFYGAMALSAVSAGVSCAEDDAAACGVGIASIATGGLGRGLTNAGRFVEDAGVARMAAGGFHPLQHYVTGPMLQGIGGAIRSTGSISGWMSNGLSAAGVWL